LAPPIKKKWVSGITIESTSLFSQNLTTPYSNAHINDLIRGYKKNPNYISGHLNTLKRLTKNLCIVQYWGNKNTTWHYRDIEEFFNSALDDAETSSDSFQDLLCFDETGIPKSLFNLMRLTSIPSNFKEIFKVSPIFSQIYPKTKQEMNMLALCQDIYNFSKMAKKDYSLYKSLRTYINQSRAKLKKQEKIFREIDKLNSGVPSQLNFDEAFEMFAPKTKTSENPACQRITNTYFKIDLKGYKSDDRFVNMIDDSLHVFYGAHCDYFVTIDDKCHYKAIETYKKLKIETKVVKPRDFFELIK